MRIVVGHANPDFDAYASTVAATRLLDGALGVFLGSQNSNVREFHNLHEDFVRFVDLKGLDLAEVDSVVMVDTRDPRRIGELGAVVLRPGVDVVIYDHHRPQEGDLVVEEDHSIECGATTTILVRELRERGIVPTVLEASLYLLGIHEDTGSLTYPGTTALDADAAAWLMAHGADMEVLNRFLTRTLDSRQKQLLEQLESTLEIWTINGQRIAVGTAVSDEYVDSAGVLTHYVVEDMGHRVAIGVIRMPERTQVVARSRLAEVDVGEVMALLGGGGHAQAASAGFRSLSVEEALVRVREALERTVKPPLRVIDVMSSPVRTIGPDVTMGEARELMARWGHGGLPVLSEGRLAGVITRKDVDKAVRHDLAHAPVKGFMGRDVVTVSPDVELSDVERMLARRGIGRVPVVSDGQLVGIVTRKDVLRVEHGDSYLERGAPSSRPEAARRFRDGVERVLPDDVREVLYRIGRHASDSAVRAHVVGGFVRDMLLGRENLDIDVVVEGDGVAFGLRLADELKGRVKVHRRFGTAVVTIGRSFHVDVASSRAEYYARPAALPTVERSTLRQDLFRRDFTINAMAACLDPTCFGEIMDPYGGLDDLAHGVVRVLHGMSFVEDPTRVLRAARFEVRYGFVMDRATEDYARQAVSLGLLAEVSGARIREELYDILQENDPVAVLRRLDEIGACEELLPVGGSCSAACYAVEEALAGMGRLMETGGVHVDRRVLLVGALSSSGTRDGADRWVRHLRIGREQARAATELSHAAGAERGLRDRRKMRNSRLAALLDPFSAEALVLLWARGDSLARERIEHYVSVVRQLRPAVSGSDLIALGAQPSEAFSAILARARADRLDGVVVGREAELANLRRLALREGLVKSGKDPA